MLPVWKAIPPSFDTSVSQVASSHTLGEQRCEKLQADPTEHIENNKDDNVILPDHVAQNAHEDSGPRAIAVDLCPYRRHACGVEQGSEDVGGQWCHPATLLQHLA